MRWTEGSLREQLEAAIKTASELLAENYLAQDRRRLIRCMELLDEASRAIDGGAWIAEVPDPVARVVAPPPAPEPARSGGLIAREARKAG